MRLVVGYGELVGTLRKFEEDFSLIGALLLDMENFKRFEEGKWGLLDIRGKSKAFLGKMLQCLFWSSACPNLFKFIRRKI